MEVFDLAPGLWIWRLEHPRWHEGADWQEVVMSVCVDAGGERWLLDPLLPPPAAGPVWDRFGERAPTAVALVIPDHSRPAWDDPRAGRGRQQIIEYLKSRLKEADHIGG